MVVTSSYDGEIHLWSRAGSKLTTLGNFEQPAFNTQFSPDGSKVLVSGALPSFYLYSLTPEGQVQNVIVI